MLGAPTDAALLERLRKGEARAFDAVFDAHRLGLLSFLTRMCRDRAAAEDIFQETWIRFARNAPALPLDTPIGPWLFRVARNLAVSHHRRIGIFLRTFHRVEPTVSPVRDPAELAEGKQQAERLERAIRALPIRDREVILLVCVEGMAPKDAGEVLGLSGEATRQRLARARKTLASLLEKEES